MRFKDGEYLFVVWDRLALKKTPVDLVDLPHSVLEEVRDLIDLPGWFPLCGQFQKECFNAADKVSAVSKIGLDCGKACNGVPERGGIGDQVDPPSFVVETPFHRATPFHQATTERPAGLICGEKIGLARLPPTAVPSRRGSEMSTECGTPLYAD